MSLEICRAVIGTFSPSGAGPQAQPLVGAKVGDIVFGIFPNGTSPFTNGGQAPYVPSATFNSFFEPAISVVNEIQQLSGPDLSGDSPCTILLFRKT